MNRLHRLLLITFIESLATIMVERGVYFYSHARLNFNDTQNLLLALGIGVAYVVGALTSHRLARRWPEKHVLATVVAMHFLSHVSLAVFPHVLPFILINLFLSGVTGAKWPLLESYINAGRSPEQTARAVGQFNLAWSLAVPLGMTVVGPLVKLGAAPALVQAHLSGLPLFSAAAAVNLATLWLIRPLETAPVHLAPDHPERLPEATLARYRRLQLSGRLAMLGSYTLLFLPVPLMPVLFERFGYTVAGPALASLVEVARFLTFVAMFFYAGWRGRRSVMALAAIGLPLGFYAVLTGASLPVVLAGELIFGVAAGAAYYGALYYAMVVADASVESGGAHESLVGGGFAFGPLLGLIGVLLAPHLQNQTMGMVAVTGPLTLVGLGWALWVIRPMRVTVQPAMADHS